MLSLVDPCGTSERLFCVSSFDGVLILPSEVMALL